MRMFVQVDVSDDGHDAVIGSAQLVLWVAIKLW